MEDDEPRRAVRRPLLADPLCARCSHSAHPYLPCGTGCDCDPTPMPGAEGFRGLKTPG